jgi:hypothetical protein
MPGPAKIRSAYAFAMLPAVAFAAEQGISDPWMALLMQLGVGGLVAMLAVKVALMLYQDKEKASAEYHKQVLELTKQQIDEISRSRQAIEKLESAVERHNDDFVKCAETLEVVGDLLIDKKKGGMQ